MPLKSINIPPPHTRAHTLEILVQNIVKGNNSYDSISVGCHVFIEEYFPQTYSGIYELYLTVFFVCFFLIFLFIQILFYGMSCDKNIISDAINKCSE